MFSGDPDLQLYRRYLVPLRAYYNVIRLWFGFDSTTMKNAHVHFFAESRGVVANQKAVAGEKWMIFPLLSTYFSAQEVYQLPSLVIVTASCSIDSTDCCRCHNCCLWQLAASQLPSVLSRNYLRFLQPTSRKKMWSGHHWALPFNNILWRHSLSLMQSNL